MKNCYSAIDNGDLSYKNLKTLVCAAIDNKKGWQELESLNNTGEFLWKHPILKEHKIRKDFLLMKKTNPQEFLKKHTNNTLNIKRYQSQIKNQKLSEKEIAQKENHIERLLFENEILKNLINVT